MIEENKQKIKNIKFKIEVCSANVSLLSRNRFNDYIGEIDKEVNKLNKYYKELIRIYKKEDT